MMEDFENTMINGELFNQMMFGREFIKVVDGDHKEGTQLLKDGLNEKSFTSQTNYYAHGGITFVDKENVVNGIKKSYNSKSYYHVEVPDDAQVVIEKDTFSADSLMLKDETPLEDLDCWKDPEFCKEASKITEKVTPFIIGNLSEDDLVHLVKDHHDSIKYIENPSDKVCKAAIDKSWLAFREIKNPNYEICMYAIEKDTWNFKHIPEEYITIDMAIQFIEKSPHSINDVPVQFRSDELYVYTLKNTPYNINNIKEMTPEILHKIVEICPRALTSYRNNLPEGDEYYDIYKKLVSVRGSAIMDIPKKFKTFDICFEAVKEDGKMLRHCPKNTFTEEQEHQLLVESFKTDASGILMVSQPTTEMYEAAAHSDPKWLTYLDSPPEDAILDLIEKKPTFIKEVKEPTYNMYLKAVSKNGYLLKDAPEEYHTEELCLAAIDDVPASVEHVKRMTQLIALTAVIKSWSCIKYIPEEFQNDEICNIAIKAYPLTLEHIKCQTLAMCKKATDINPGALEYAKFQTSEMVDKCVKERPYLARYASKSLLSEELIFELIKKDPYQIENLDNPPEELCIQLVSKNGFVLRSIKNPSYRTCLEAVKDTIYAFKHVPEEHQTFEICEIVYKNTPREMSELKNKSPELLFDLFERYPEVLRYIKPQTVNLCLGAVILNPKCVEHVVDSTIKNNCKFFIEELVGAE